MPIVVSWDNEEKSIVLLTFSGLWTVEEFDEAVRNTQNMMRTVSNVVDHIADLRGSGVVPKGAMAHVTRSMDKPLPNDGLTFIVGLAQHPIIKLLFDAGLRLAPHHRQRYRFVDTVEEARQQSAAATERPDLGQPPSDVPARKAR